MKKRFFLLIFFFCMLKGAFSQTDISFALGSSYTLTPPSGEKAFGVDTASCFSLTTYIFAKENLFGIFFPIDVGIDMNGGAQNCTLQVSLATGVSYKISFNEESIVRFALAPLFAFKSETVSATNKGTALCIGACANCEYLYEAFSGEYLSPNLVLGVRVHIPLLQMGLSGTSYDLFSVSAGIFPYAGISLKLRPSSQKKYVVNKPGF